MPKAEEAPPIEDPAAYANAVENPILNKPYQEPARWWHFEKGEKPQVMDGRRPAEYVFGVMNEKTSVFESEKMALCDGRVEHLRKAVKTWREAGYPNATKVTKELLAHWTNPERERRLFFCQREAVETIIFLTEGPQDQRQALDEMVPNDTEDRDAFRRSCVKMATGSGKTFVMAMLAAWSVLNKVQYRQDKRFSDTVLVVCPNLTVKERLQVLLPSSDDNYYQKFDLVPRHLMPDLHRGKFFVTNWHLFAPYEDAKRSVVKLGEESDEAFTKRVLRDLGDGKNVLVLNDEAHHAYRIRDVQGALKEVEEGAKGKQAKLKADVEADPTVEDEVREATVWVEGLDRIHKVRGIQRCIDLSATPMFGKGSGAEGVPFDWIVSDFSLVDAIECGIVKIPRIPILDNSGNEDPKYLNIWQRIKKKVPKRKSGDGLPTIKVLAEAEGALIQVADQWRATFQQWQGSGRSVPPCMIVVCNDTRVAEIIANHIGKDGALDGLKNQDGKDPVTVRIDSALLRKAEAAVEAGKSAGDAAEELRTKVSTIGKEGKPGEQVRCVVSVAMLSEGWDASNVTQIFGLRAFTSQLLCEQVVGRGLRRMSYDVDENGYLMPEYVDVYGIPFQVIPVAKGKVGVIAPQAGLETVKARNDRARLAMKWPRVSSYVFDVRHDLEVDKDGWEPITIEPADEPTWTEVKELVGYATVTKPDPDAPGGVVRQGKEWFYQTHRVQRTIFEIAARITNNWKAVETRMIFPLIRDAVEDYVTTKVRVLGDARIEEIAMQKHMRDIEGKVLGSLRPADKKAGMLPVIDEKGSTEGLVFQTAKSTYPTKKSHLSHAVIDSKWERQAAIDLDDSPEVEAWVKTDRTGFAIPYQHVGITHEYRPDFIARVNRNDGTKVHVIVEIKGQDRAPDKDKRQAAKRWVESMNYLHTQTTDPESDFGMWAYVYLKDEQRYQLKKLLTNLAEGKAWPEGVVAFGP